MIRVFPGVGFPSSSQTITRYEWGKFDANNYYDALGLTPDCTFQEIKKAFRELARRYHPDGEEPDTETFRELKEIYEVLSDPVKRGEYSRLDPAKKETWMGPLEKEALRDDVRTRGIPPDQLVTSKKKETKFFSYYADSISHDIAQEWYEHVLNAAYLYRYHGVVRIGISSDLDKPCEISSKMSFLVLWFHKSVPPNWISAFQVVSLFTDFLWKS